MSAFSSDPGNPAPVMLGVMLASMLFGATSQQTLFYFRHFRSDGWVLQCMVLSVWILDALTIAFDTHLVYFYFLNSLGEREVFGNTIWSFSAQQFATTTTIFLAQAFLILQIWKLRREVYIGSNTTSALLFAFGFMALYSIAMGYNEWTTTSKCLLSLIQHHYEAISVMCLSHSKWVDSYHAVQPYLISNVAVETVLGILVTLALVHLLQDHRNEFFRRKGPIERLVTFFMTRGFVMTTFQVVLFVFVVIKSSGPLVRNALCMCQSKVYALSLLAILSNRDYERRRLLRMDFTSEFTLTVPDITALSRSASTLDVQDDRNEESTSSGSQIGQKPRDDTQPLWVNP